MTVYQYPDECGRVLLQKLRYQKVPPPTQDMPFPLPVKAFKTEGRSREDYMFVKPTALYGLHPELYEYFHSLLYGLPELLRAIPAGWHGNLYWTEGERDADSIIKAGGLAVSHWQGATSATPAQAARLLPWFGGVVVCADMDAKGAACALRRYRLLREAGIPYDRLSVVRPAGPEVLKRDVTDHLNDGYALDELVPMDLHKLERYVGQLTPSQVKEGSDDYKNFEISNWAPTALRRTQAGEGRGAIPSPAPLSPNGKRPRTPAPIPSERRQSKGTEQWLY